MNLDYNFLSGLANMDLSNEGRMLIECYFSSFLYDYLEPTETQCNEWRHDPDGKKKFLQHINAKLGCKNLLSLDITEAMYRYFVSKTPYTRSNANYKKIKYPRRCVVCGNPAVTVDHKIPIALGGTNGVDNLHYLCGNCNSKKNSRIAFSSFFNEATINFNTKKSA